MVGCAQLPCDEGTAKDGWAFGEEVTTLSLEVSEHALGTLPEEAREESVEVAATLELHGERHEVGLRLKGQGSFRSLDGKAAFKIDGGSAGALGGLRRLTLNNLVQDPSGLSEALAYRLYAAAGVPAPRSGFACVSVNGTPYGLHSVVETMDEELLERLFDDGSGTLWEGLTGGDLTETGQHYVEVEEAGQGDPAVRLQELVSVLGEDFAGTLDSHFVREELLALFAVDVVTGNHDAYTTRANNWHLYHQPTSDTWHLLPWGTDQGFVRVLDPQDPAATVDSAQAGRLWRGCWDDPACADDYLEAVTAVEDLVASEGLAEVADAWTDRLAGSWSAGDFEEHGGFEVRRARRDVQRYLGP